MRKFTLGFCVLVLMFVSQSAAQVPGEIGYQGILTDSLGNPIPTGTFGLTFTIYAEEEGGSALWTEDQSVKLQEGLFTVQLGDQTPMELAFDEAYWLGIQVDGGAELVSQAGGER